MAGAVHGEGVDGLTRDKTRKPGKQPLPTTIVQRIDLTLGPPPGEATHWTGRMLAKAAGVSLRSVQRILEAHQLAPHRIRTFKLSTDPQFGERLKDVFDPKRVLAAVKRGKQTLESVHWPRREQSCCCCHAQCRRVPTMESRTSGTSIGRSLLHSIRNPGRSG